MEKKLIKLNNKEIEFLYTSFMSKYFYSLYIEEQTQNVYLNKEDKKRLERLMLYKEVE